MVDTLPNISRQAIVSVKQHRLFMLICTEEFNWLMLVGDRISSLPHLYATEGIALSWTVYTAINRVSRNVMLRSLAKFTTIMFRVIAENLQSFGRRQTNLDLELYFNKNGRAR